MGGSLPVRFQAVVKENGHLSCAFTAGTTSLNDQVVNTWPGPFHEDDHEAMKQAALRCLADSGHTMGLLDS